MYTNSKEFLKILDAVKVHGVLLGLPCSQKTEVFTRRLWMKTVVPFPFIFVCLVMDLCWLASFQDKMHFHCESWVVVQDSSAFWSIFICIKSQAIIINDEFMEMVLLPKFLTLPSCFSSSVLPQFLPPKCLISAYLEPS